MAKEKDITSRPKFFTRKKGVTDDKLCDRCKHHNHVIMVRHGCDAIMFSNTKLRSSEEAARQARDGISIHFWCLEDREEPPPCLEFFREVRAVK